MKARMPFLLIMIAVVLCVHERAATAGETTRRMAPRYPAEASQQERQALDKLAAAVQGAVIYTRDRRVRMVVIGDWRPIDLGEGDFARWSPCGERIAVISRGDVYVMNADGSNRRKLVAARATGINCPLEFHTNGREILYSVPNQGLYAVDISNGAVRSMNLGYDGEMGISADGLRLVGRIGNRLYAVELPGTRHRNYASGCSPGVSPDGQRLMHNMGDHRTMTIQNWDGSNKIIINADTCLPDRKWDNQHWSNHNDYIAVQGDAAFREVYVFSLSQNQGIRVTWERKANHPDLWVKLDEATAPAVIQKETDAAAQQHVSVPLKTWPGDAAKLVFFWEDATKTNQIITEDGQGGRTCAATPRGRAIFSRTSGMDLTGGAFIAEDVNDELLQACRASNELTIEALITPANIHQTGPARIVSFSSDTNSRNFTLGQIGDKLVLRLRTPRTGANAVSPTVELLKLEAGKPHHVIVTYQPGLLKCYLNGAQVLSSAALQGDFSNWEPQHLVFGDEWSGGRGWDGHLEGSAIYSRALSAEEAKQQYDLFSPRLAERSEPKRCMVRATLRSASPAPKWQDIGTYTRVLVDFVYDVEEVLDGECEHERIIVSHWAILDREYIPLRDEIGSRRVLLLERYEDNPQLESELRIDSDEFDLPIYNDVRREM